MQNIKCPGYKYLDDRINSFDGFNASSMPPILDMAKAGFFARYSQNGNCGGKCFHCGLLLGNWDPDDEPLVEHIRWSHKCQFMKESIPNKFFIKILLVVIRGVDDEDTINSMKRSILNTESAKAVLEMGYSPEDIIKSMQLLEEDKKEICNARNIVLYIMYVNLNRKLKV